MADHLKPRRPSYQEPISLEALAERDDPIGRAEAAHEAASILLHTGRHANDPAATQRLVALVDEIGISTLADVWEASPARTLPGALYRLYVIREWIARVPDDVAAAYAAGTGESPTPDEMRALADDILRGVFTDDVAQALDDAAAFCATVVAGREEHPVVQQGDLSDATLAQLATDLSASARDWRSGTLV